MQKKLGSALRKSFSIGMKEGVREFTEDSVSKFGSVIYRRNIIENLTGFVCLEISPKKDQFTIELAWSRNGSYPFEIITMLPSDSPKDQALRFRLSRLWKPTGDEHWWRFTKSRLDPDYRDESLEELLPKIDPFVKDAIGKIIEYAVPYFKTLK